MPLRLATARPGFERAFARFLEKKRERALDVNEVVARILAAVRKRGDRAVLEYTARLDRVRLTPQHMRVSEAEATIP